MPVQKCSTDGVSGWKWGKSGKCFTGFGAKAKAAKQGRAIRASGFVGNRKRTVTKSDPTRTKTLRRAFEREIRRIINHIKRQINKQVGQLDGFALNEQNGPDYRLVRRIGTILGVNTNAKFEFARTSKQVDEFEKWIQEQLGELASTNKDKYWEEFVAKGYEKGAGRAFTDSRKAQRAQAAGSAEKAAHFAGSKEEFLRSAFGQAESVDKLKLLASRTFTDLKNVESATAAEIRRVLTDGLAQGKNPWEIARDLNKAVDTIGKNRALIIARTEIIRAHSEGQLDALEQLGVEEVGVMVEWSTAGDDRVCPLCQPLEGVVLKTKEARGIIPRHPQCRCAFVPANVGEGTKGQVRGKSSIDDRFGTSVDREERRKRVKRKRSKWVGADKTISEKRPPNLFD